MNRPIYRVVCADPAWRFDDKLPGTTRGAARNYRTMSLKQIVHYSLPTIADDAFLFLWRLSAMPTEALKVIDAWGFKPKTEIVWKKLTKTGKRHFGMGHYVRAEHETCIVATRGRPKVKNHSTRSVFEAPIGKHSEKPEQFYDIVEELCAGPYVELFARRRRNGWTCLGNEVGKLQ